MTKLEILVLRPVRYYDSGHESSGFKNQLFYEYQKFTQKKGTQAEPLKKELKTLEKNTRKYEKIKRQLKEIDDEVTDFKLDYTCKNISLLSL